MRRLGVLAVLCVACFGLTGCPFEPSGCGAIVRFDTVTWCAGGVQSSPGGGTQETTIGAWTDDILLVASQDADLTVHVETSVNAHGFFDFQLKLHESSTVGVPDGYGVGTYGFLDEPGHTRIIAAADHYNAFVVSGGSVTITSLELADALPGIPESVHRDVTKMRATFELETDHGHLTGSISIG